MNPIIQLANPKTDYAFIANLLTAWRGRLVTVADLIDEDEPLEGRIHQWWVATTPEKELIGAAYAVHYPSQPKDRFHGYAVVQDKWRRQGVGTALYGQLNRFLQENRAYEWHSYVNDGEGRRDSSLDFATQNGFELVYQSFDSTLNLATFDDAPFAGIIEAVEAQGIRFFTFDTVGDDPVAQRKLYEANRASGLAEPGTDSYSTFENWKSIVLDAAWFKYEYEFVAAEGDRFVGLGGAFPTAEAGIFENVFTGIIPAYQGRKIGQALKLLAIRQAINLKATQIHTQSDSRNEPMLAINRKLGFQPNGRQYSFLRKTI